MIKKAILKVRIHLSRAVIRAIKSLKCKHGLDEIWYDDEKKATILYCPVCKTTKVIPDEPRLKRAEQKRKHKAPLDHAKHNKKKKP